uniref:Uncharacterized protein n=1 Tax=Acrobeloides nanus TaxID=290746 RepID=A0A914D2A0_9BILA
MMYAGSAPQLISCGSHDLSHIQDTAEACLLLKTIQQNESCVPEFHVQFSSVNYECYLDNLVIVLEGNLQ